MAHPESSEPGFTEDDSPPPSDTLAAEGSQAPTVAGEDQSLAAVTQPSGNPPDSIEAFPFVERDHYAVGAVFAQGGIGQISAAMDRRLGRRVAIKELRRSTHYSRLRFAREINITAKLQHPNIVQLHEAGRWSNGELFFAMKLVDGDSLEGAIESCVTLKDHLHLLRHVTDVADAMAHAHTRRIVHRDLKPGNVLVGPFGETVVIDWGLAKDLAEEEDDEDELVSAGATVPERYATTDGVVLGTPSYMPPEQAAGRAVDERADVYALGAIMYQALSGKTPYFDYHPKRVLERVIAAPPMPLETLQPGLPKDLLAIVQKAMARDPNERYRTAASMAEELTRYTNGRLVAAYDYSPAELVRRFMLRHRTTVATAFVGLLVLLGFGGWSFRRIARERDTAETAQLAEAQARKLETEARAAAERRLDDAVLSAARSDLERDPTRAVARLKRLGTIIPGAATVAADAVERGVAVRVLRGHSDRIDTVAYSADGKHMASSGVDGVIRLENRETKTTRLLSRHKARVPAIAFTGQQLVSADYAGEIIVWETATGAVETTLSGTANKEIRAIAVDAAGKRVAVVAEDGVQVWNLATGVSSAKFEIDLDRSAYAEFAPGAQSLVTGSHDGQLRVWDLAGDDHGVLKGHVGAVRGAAVSVDGKWVVSAGKDGTVRKWDLSTREGVVLGRHDGGAQVVQFLDSQHVVTGGMDGKVVVWHLEDKTSRVVAHHHERVTALTTLGSRWIASAGWDKDVVLIDTVSNMAQTLTGHDSFVSALAFSPAGDELASASWDRTVRVWPTERPHRQLLGHAVGVKTVAFDAAGKRLVSGGHDDVVRVWDVETGNAVIALPGHTDHVFRVLFSPDGKMVASSSDDRTVRLWRVADGTHTKFEGHLADVEELAFSSDDKWLASACEDSRVGLWPADGQGESRGTLLRSHKKAVTAVAFMPGDQTLVTASLDGVIALWSVPDGRMGKQQKSHVGGATSIAVSDGGLIASVGRDGRVMVWDVASAPRLIARHAGAERVSIAKDGSMVAFASTKGDVGLCDLKEGKSACRVLVGHEERVVAMHFVAGNAQLVTGSEDGTVRIWSTATGESRPLRMHHAAVFDIAVSGSWIASASGDRTIGLLRLSPPVAPDKLRAELDRLTELVLPANVDAAAAVGDARAGETADAGVARPSASHDAVP